MLHWIRALDRVLKGEATRPSALQGGTIDLPVGGLSVVVTVLAAAYGACMGSFALMARWGGPTRTAGYQQMLASAAKVPMLFLLTLLVTFPSLYVFNALVGSRLAFVSVVRLMLAALGVLMAVLASFGTIVVFFSLCTTSYPFIVLLNVVMFAVAGLLGMRFLLQTLHRLSVARAAEAMAVAGSWLQTPPPVEPAANPLPGSPSANVPPPIPGALDRLEGQVLGRHVKTVFRIWILVFALVGAQMSWVLRPFIGNPNTPFTFFRDRQSNFFEAVIYRVGEAVNWDSVGRRHRHSSGDDSTGVRETTPPSTQPYRNPSR